MTKKVNKHTELFIGLNIKKVPSTQLEVLKYRTALFKKIISSSNQTIITSGDEYIFLKRVLSRKYHISDDAKFEIYPISYNNLSLGAHLDIINGDERIEKASVSACIKNRNKTDRQILMAAARNAIMFQILDWSNKHRNKVCKICNTKINIQVDHIYPFRSIFKDFLKNNKLPKEINYERLFNGSHVFASSHDEFVDKWRQYHKETATYQYLCQKCNIKKH